jgi:glucokinase
MSQTRSAGQGVGIIDSPGAVRRINRAQVLRVIQLDGPITRPETVKLTGLSKATVREVCDGLLDEGLIEEEIPTAHARRGPGRPAGRLRFRGAQGHVIGIDVGADKVLVLLAELGGRVLATHRTGLIADRRPVRDQVLAAVARAVKGVLSKAGVDAATVRTVVAGTPGVVAPDTGIISLAPQIVGWDGTRLAHELERRLPCRPIVENEVQLAVIGERWRGAAYDLDAAVYLQLGIGVAAGILINGVLHRGVAGGAGEIGYLPVRGGAPPPDGFGAFEWNAGGRAFAREAQAAAQRPKGARLLALAGGDLHAIDARTVFTAAREGDAAAEGVVIEMADRIAEGVAVLACVLNPAVVVVGGGLSKAGAALLEPLERAVQKLIPLPPRLVLSPLGEQAVALGALRLALETAHAHLDLHPVP